MLTSYESLNSYGAHFQDGSNGSPGAPGVSLWQVKGSKPDRILIPPRISGGPYDSDQVGSIIYLSKTY